MALAAASSGSVRQVDVSEDVELQARVEMSKRHERGFSRTRSDTPSFRSQASRTAFVVRLSLAWESLLALFWCRCQWKMWRECLGGRLLTAVCCAFHRKLSAR